MCGVMLNKKCDISGSIGRTEAVETIKYSGFKGEFPCKSVYDAPSTDEYFVCEEISSASETIETAKCGAAYGRTDSQTL